MVQPWHQIIVIVFSAVFLPILFDKNNEETPCEGYADVGYVQGLYTYSEITMFVYTTVLKLPRLLGIVEELM
jgi:hypothetical protein